MKYQSEMNQDDRHHNHKSTKKTQRPKIRIQKSREQEVYDAIKKTHKIEFEIESSAISKLSRRRMTPKHRARKYKNGANYKLGPTATWMQLPIGETLVTRNRPTFCTPSEVPPIRTNWKDQLVLGSSLGNNTSKHTWIRPAVLSIHSFINISQSPHCPLIVRIPPVTSFTKAS